MDRYFSPACLMDGCAEPAAFIITPTQTIWEKGFWWHSSLREKYKSPFDSDQIWGRIGIVDNVPIVSFWVYKSQSLTLKDALRSLISCGAITLQHTVHAFDSWDTITSVGSFFPVMKENKWRRALRELGLYYEIGD